MAILLTLTGCSGGGKNHTAGPVSEETLSRLATATRVKYNLPAIATAAINSGTITTNVIGVRKQGGTDAVTRDDHFHLGSCAKAMTVSVLAMYIEAGKVSWDTRLRDIFPEIADTMRPEYRDMTLETMLSMRSGLPLLPGLGDILQVPKFTGNTTQQRRAFVKWAFQQTPESVPGEYAYSNSNYIIAGAVLEQIAGKEWSTLLQERLFGPLDITSVGYGWPARNGAKQPWGHILTDGNWLPHNPDDTTQQIPLYMAPAGDVFMSIGDYAKFVQWHLRGLRGQATLLKPQTFQKLHTAPEASSFAPGAWATEELDGVPTSYYIGSAGTFLAEVVLQPGLNRAFIAITNADGDNGTSDVAGDAMDEILKQVLQVSATRSLASSPHLPGLRLRQ